MDGYTKYIINRGSNLTEKPENAKPRPFDRNMFRFHNINYKTTNPTSTIGSKALRYNQLQHNMILLSFTCYSITEPNSANTPHLGGGGEYDHRPLLMGLSGCCYGLNIDISNYVHMFLC